MMSKAIRATVIVFIFTILGSIFSYAFRIFLARNLSVSEYGLFYAIFGFLSIFTMFIDLGLSQAVTKHVVELNVKKKQDRAKWLITTVFTIQMLISATLFVILLLSSSKLSGQFFKSESSLPFILMGIWFVTLPIPVFLTNIFWGSNRPDLSSSQEFFRQLCAIGLTILFFSLGYAYLSPFIAYCLINILMMIFYFPIIPKVFPNYYSLKSKKDNKLLGNVFKYGIFVTFSALITTVISQTDTVMLTYLKGTEAVGLYQIAVPIAMLITYSSGAMMTVAFPLLSEMNARRDKKKFAKAISLIYKYVMLVSIPIAMAIILYSDLMIRILFGANYIGADTTLKILAIGTLLGLYTSVNNNILLSIGKPQETTKNMILAAVANLILNILLIPSMGIVGAALASLAAYVLAVIKSTMTVLDNLKSNRSDINLWRTITGVLCFIPGFLLVQKLRYVLTMNVFVEIAILAALFATTSFLLLIWMKVIDFEEMKEFFRLAKSDA